MPPVLGVTSIDVDGRDCHGTLGGSAAIDGCGRCTGGNTGYAFNANGAGNSCELPPVIASLEVRSNPTERKQEGGLGVGNVYCCYWLADCRFRWVGWC